MKTSLFSLVLLSLVYTGCATTNRFTKVADKHLQNTVKISVESTRVLIVNGKPEIQQGHIGGTGILVTKRGHILTAAHLFPEDHGAVVVITHNEPLAEYGGTIMKVDHEKDLALVKIDYYSRSPAKLAPINSVQIGEEVVAIGHPLNLDWTVTHGIVSRFEDKYVFVQTDASVNPGNSGGPLFDLEGRLIGINSHLYTEGEGAASAGLNMASSIKSIHNFFYEFKGLEQVQ